MVKRYTLLLFIISFLLPAVLGAQQLSENHASFKNGVRLYKQGDFAQSAQAFEDIVNNGVQSGEVYFNLGNAYFKLNDYGHARLMYERAKRFLPRDQDLEGNIAFLTTRLDDKVSLPPPNLVWKMFFFIGEWCSINELCWIVAALFVLSMALWTVMLCVSSRKNMWRILLYCGLAVVLWAGAVLLLKIKDESSGTYAVITARETPVRWGNTPDDKVAFYLHAGTKVRIRTQRGDWYLITLGADKTGWIQQSEMECI